MVTGPHTADFEPGATVGLYGRLEMPDELHLQEGEELVVMFVVWGQYAGPLELGSTGKYDSKIGKYGELLCTSQYAKSSRTRSFFLPRPPLSLLFVLLRFRSRGGA